MCGMHYQRWKRLGTTELEQPERQETCTVELCELPVDRPGPGLCEAHYYQIRRNGEITSAVVAARPRKAKAPKGPPKARPRRTECKVPGCTNPPPICRGWCRSHYSRWQRHGDPQRTVPQNERNWPTGEANTSWKGDEAGYGAAHHRVVRLRGLAKTHRCAHCREPADEWAYDHDDPSESVCPDDGPFSTNPDRYVPLCKRCHRRFDYDYLARTLSPRMACSDCRRWFMIGLPSCPACGAASAALVARDLHADGASVTAIAARIGSNRSTVRRWLALWPRESEAA